MISGSSVLLKMFDPQIVDETHESLFSAVLNRSEFL